VLARWLPADLVEEQPAAEETAAAERPAAEVIALDQSVLDNIRAIDDDGTVLNEVIRIYLDEVPEHVAQLRAALAARDAARLAAVAHALKSASFNVGAPALGELCRRLERQGKVGEIAEAADLVGEIEALLGNVQPLLRAEMRLAA